MLRGPAQRSAQYCRWRQPLCTPDKRVWRQQMVRYGARCLHRLSACYRWLRCSASSSQRSNPQSGMGRYWQNSSQKKSPPFGEPFNTQGFARVRSVRLRPARPNLLRQKASSRPNCPFEFSSPTARHSAVLAQQRSSRTPLSPIAAPNCRSLPVGSFRR